MFFTFMRRSLILALKRGSEFVEKQVLCTIVYLQKYFLSSNYFSPSLALLLLLHHLSVNPLGISILNQLWMFWLNSEPIPKRKADISIHTEQIKIIKLAIRQNLKKWKTCLDLCHWYGCSSKKLSLSRYSISSIINFEHFPPAYFEHLWTYLNGNLETISISLCII